MWEGGLLDCSTQPSKPAGLVLDPDMSFAMLPLVIPFSFFFPGKFCFCVFSLAHAFCGWEGGGKILSMVYELYARGKAGNNGNIAAKNSQLAGWQMERSQKN